MFAKIYRYIPILWIAPVRLLAQELDDEQSKELTVFAGIAMGAAVTVSDIKNVLSREELEQLVATGLNLNGHLCAAIKSIRPLRIESTYEVTCTLYRDDVAEKSYVVDALKGVAFEPWNCCGRGLQAPRLLGFKIG